MEKRDLDQIKVAITDVFSDFYNDVIKKDTDERFSDVQRDISDLKLSTEALVKIVEYSKLEARVTDLEDKLNAITSKK
ncbi:MAG: hypothetical protein AAGF85_08565 [Bacteroidota bacterium]